jgi:hypothetical protein
VFLTLTKSVPFHLLWSMRCHLLMTGVLLVALSGCKGPKQDETGFSAEPQRRAFPAADRGGLKPGAPVPVRAAPLAPSFPQVAPISEKNGKVAAARPELRFVVVDFYINGVPQVGERLSVYRGGLKVGEVRISGPGRGNNIAADVTAGEARVGDDVRPD